MPLNRRSYGTRRRFGVKRPTFGRRRFGGRRRVYRRSPFQTRGVRGTTGVVNLPTAIPYRTLTWPTVNGAQPAECRIKMRYADPVITIANATYHPYYAYQINSIFDPDKSADGHQPDLHDAMSAIYRRYQVQRCDYRIKLRNTSGARVAVGVTLISGTAYCPLDAESVLQRCNQSAMLDTTADNGLNQVVFTGSVDVNRLCGCAPGQKLFGDDFESPFYADPVQKAWLVIATSAVDNSTVISGLTGSVELVFHVLCRWAWTSRAPEIDAAQPSGAETLGAEEPPEVADAAAPA